MPGLVPGIHVFASEKRKTWMAVTSTAMTSVDDYTNLSLLHTSPFSAKPTAQSAKA
jgi:hypothetical protein